MTNEEIQRVMEFIIKQQESFAEGMEQLRVSQAQAEARVSRLESATIHLYNAVAEVNKAVAATNKAQESLAARIAELAEAQAHTEQRLNVLIDIIEQGRGEPPQS